MLTCHSEYGEIQSLYIKTIEAGFLDQRTISQQWEALNYISEPLMDEAICEYANFKSILDNNIKDIKTFGANNQVTMDSIYCRDSSIATDHGLILCNMGKGSRKNEPKACKQDFDKYGEPILGQISSPGTLEGGDVAWLNEKTIAVGQTYRTNEEGIRQLKSFLQAHDIEVLVVDLPHYKGPSDVFHLMSILSPVDKDLAMVYSPLMPISFRKQLINKGFKLVEVPEEEFESMGCNILAISPRNCIMVEGNPITKSRLEKAGATIQTYKGNDISIKGGGGPTCLTRPLLRKI